MRRTCGHCQRQWDRCNQHGWPCNKAYSSGSDDAQRSGFMDPAVHVRAVQGDTPSVPFRVHHVQTNNGRRFTPPPTKPIACHSSHGFEGCSCAPGRELSRRMRALTKECACSHTIRCYRSANVSFSPRGETNSSMRIADRCLAPLTQISAAVLASSARDRAWAGESWRPPYPH